MLNTKKALFIGAVSAAILITNTTCCANLAEDVQNKGTKNSIQMILVEKLPFASSVEAHVNSEIIQFAGFVDNKEQYQQVKELGDKYACKYRIINNVKILSVKDNSHDEATLRKNVIRQLYEHKYPVDNINVQVRNGHVMLSGFVNKHIPLSEINTLPKEVPGVTNVDNYLLYKQA